MKRDSRDKCFLPAWGSGVLFGSAAGCPLCGRHPDLSPLLLLTWIFQRPHRRPPTSPSSPSAPALGDSPHCFLLLGPLSLWWCTGETASNWAAFHSIPSVHNKIPHSSPNAKCWAWKLLHFTPSCCSTFSFQFSIPLTKLGRGKSAHLWYKQTANWWTSREQEKRPIPMQPASRTTPPPHPPQGCRRPPISLSPCPRPQFLSAYCPGSGWQSSLGKQSKLNCFLISPEKDVWSLVIYYLFFGPWYFALSFGFQLLILEQQKTFPRTF